MISTIIIISHNQHIMNYSVYSGQLTEGFVYLSLKHILDRKASNGSLHIYTCQIDVPMWLDLMVFHQAVGYDSWSSHI